MKRIICGLCLLASTLFMQGCDPCDSAPDSYEGAQMSGYYASEYGDCAHYDNDRCSYTLCENPETEACGWYLQSWYCV
jgi:hypothetical protein